MLNAGERFIAKQVDSKKKKKLKKVEEKMLGWGRFLILHFHFVGGGEGNSIAPLKFIRDLPCSDNFFLRHAVSFVAV